MRIKNLSKNSEYRVEVAKTPWQRAAGLSGRKKGGMFFLFQSPGKHGFWMWKMRFSVDLIFIQEDGTVSEVLKNLKPLSLNPMTWKLYYPKEDIRYVLELPAGSGVEKGDKLEWSLERQ